MHSLGSDPYSYDVCFIQKEDSPTRQIFEMFFVIYRNELLTAIVRFSS